MLATCVLPDAIKIQNRLLQNRMISINTILDRLDLYDVINIISFIMLLILMSRGRKSLPYLSVFLFMLIFLEVYLQVYWSIRFQYNIFVYNIISKLTVMYYIFIYYLHFRHAEWSKWILWIFGLWLILCLYFNSFAVDTIHFDKISYVSGLTFVTVLIIKYFYDIIYVQSYRNLKNDPLFYLSVGILLFFAANFPILIFADIFINNIKRNSSLYSSLISLGNIFLSLGYFSAVLCGKE